MLNVKLSSVRLSMSSSSLMNLTFGGDFDLTLQYVNSVRQLQ
jgi:hypothetical protein